MQRLRLLRFTLNLASVRNYATNKQLANTFTLFTLLLFILFIIYGLTTIKTQTINNQQLDAILGNQDSYSHALTPVEKVLCNVL